MAEQTDTEQSELESLRTYKHDVAEGLRTEGTSVVSVALQAEAKRESENETATKELRVSKRLVVGIVACVAIGAIVLAFVLFLYQRKPATSATPTPVIAQGLIYAEKRELFDISKLTPAQAYKQLALKLSGAELRPGQMQEYVPYVASSTLSTQELFPALGIKAPDRFVRFLDKSYMVGTYSFRTTSGFLILRPISYGPTFAEMLTWENDSPKILYPLLTGKALTSSTVGPEPGAMSWSDEVVKNIDTRVLRDSTGKLLLIYAFLPEKNTLVITSDLDTFNEILQRIQTPKSVTQ